MLKRGEDLERDILREPAPVKTPIIAPIVKIVEKVIEPVKVPLIKPIEKAIDLDKPLIITPPLIQPLKTIIKIPEAKIYFRPRIEKEISSKRRIINDSFQVPTFKPIKAIKPTLKKSIVDPVKIVEVAKIAEISESRKSNLLDKFFIWINSVFKVR